MKLQLVLALAGPAASREFQCRVRAAAAAHIDVNRIRRVRHHLIAQEFDGPNLGLTTSQASRKFLPDLMRLEVATYEVSAPAFALAVLADTR